MCKQRRRRTICTHKPHPLLMETRASLISKICYLFILLFTTWSWFIETSNIKNVWSLHFFFHSVRVCRVKSWKKLTKCRRQINRGHCKVVGYSFSYICSTVCNFCISIVGMKKMILKVPNVKNERIFSCLTRCFSSYIHSFSCHVSCIADKDY